MLDVTKYRTTAAKRPDAEGRSHRMSRRTWGRAAALVVILLPGTITRAAATDALLLSCMDYRLVDDTERYMAGRGLRDKYDHIILAGASLGAVTDKYPAWNTAFWEHLDVAIQLHQIHKVILMDHRDCGAYKVVLGDDFAKDAAKETAVHTATLKALRTQILAKHPKLDVELLIMNLDGKVEPVRP
jgi:carbonic anhydrase